MIIKIKRALRKIQEISKEYTEYIGNYGENKETIISEPGELNKLYLMGFNDGLIFSIGKINIAIKQEELEDEEDEISCSDN
jgi:hypothetical protein